MSDTMGQIVLSLEKKDEERLRELAKETNNGKKGAISQTVAEALVELEKKRRQQKALKRLFELANEDQDYGVGRFDRNEIYRGKRFGD